MPRRLAAELAEPPVFASVDHVLDLLIVAKPEPVNLSPFRFTGWVYDICRRPAHGNNCPPSTVSHYGGTRLQVEKGDKLKIRLVNQLPRAINSKHQYDPGFEYLLLNPTNLHTHGMLVSPHFPTVANPTYGDNVFVFTLNRANGPPPAGSYLHGLDLRYGYTDYEIDIPRSHPSGLFWFHPHAYGISLNQISAGLAGILTVGEPSDYICTTACGAAGEYPHAPYDPERHPGRSAEQAAGSGRPGLLPDLDRRGFRAGSGQLPRLRAAPAPAAIAGTGSSPSTASNIRMSPCARRSGKSGASPMPRPASPTSCNWPMRRRTATC